MARLKDIVDECLAVATAYTAINSQTYNEVNAVNYEDNDKDFPMFLFDKRNIGVNVDRFTRTNLPAQTTYSCQVLFFNTYTETEKLTIDLQTKQDDLIIIADRFFAELRTRTQSTNKGFHLGEISFNAIDETHNEQLIQLSYTVQFIANIENCDLGTFDDYLEYVNLIINEVETIEIDDSTTFNLTVTLDGVESGTYNSGTQTWEVVSEPCPPTEITFTFDNNLIAVVDTSPYNIDCSTNIDAVIVTNSIYPLMDGTYIRDGVSIADFPKYVKVGDATSTIFNNGPAWQIVRGANSINSNDNASLYPYLVDWQGDVVMAQATIEDYCGGGVCADATYTIKDSAATTLYSGSIASGGNLNQTITDSTVNVRKSDNVLISAVAVEAQGTDSYVVSDSAVTVNGNAYANVKATDSLDVAVEYSDATNVGTIGGGIVEIPDNRFNTASIIKTGQTTSYATGDDGDIERGSGADFLTLSYNNPFGNTSRFTDSAGGQTYANGEAYDWANADYVNRLVPIWYLTPQTAATWANAIAGQPYTVNSQSWYIPNVQEAYTLMNMGVENSRLNYAPFSLTSSASGQGFWTSTTNNNITANALRIPVDAALGATALGNGINSVVKTNTANFLLIRYASF